MTFEEHKEFPVDSSSLKDVRSFAREVLAKDPLFKTTSDDVVLALAEAAQNIVKHAFNGQPTGDTMRVELSFKDNQLILEKNGVDIDENEYFIRVFFENNPLVLRKVDLWINNEVLSLSIYNHNYNEQFNKDLFKLINPRFLN